MTRADRDRVRFALQDMVLSRGLIYELGVESIMADFEARRLPYHNRRIVRFALKRLYVRHAKNLRFERRWARAYEKGTPLVPQNAAQGTRRRAMASIHRTESRAYLRLYREVTKMGGNDTKGRPLASPSPSP